MSSAENKENQNIIEIKDLETRIDGNIIHQGLNLSVRYNEIFAVVGGSGSGKTVLLRAILMLQKAHGSIKIFGQELLGSTPHQQKTVRDRWGVMFQLGALFSSLTVLENIMFPLQVYTKLPDALMIDLAKLKMEMVGLTLKAQHKYPAELSGGMQKRLAIARAIALDPELLFLDEPTAGLDPAGASGLDELVLNLRSKLGLTIVMVTHDLDSLWRTTDRVAFLGNKKVLQEDTIEALYYSKEPQVKEYFSDPRSKIIRREQTE